MLHPIENYVLQRPLLEYPAGTKLQFDPEWYEWQVELPDGPILLNTRGSIGEGEAAILLHSAREKKLTSILAPA